jgi:2-polyprenyl-3-methyl-5-hydroxy-6-metoxy-1,4-benzoquinol methylase
MKSQTPGLYDRDRYYDSDGQASRLAPSLNSLLSVLDKHKAKSTARVYRRVNGVQNASTPKRVLDIGAGDGKFLYFMRQLGFETEGTTASAISQKAAFDKYGIKLEHTTDIPPRIRDIKFDVITYWHVFEHLEDPAAHVSLWKDMLAPGGLIVIEVPNVESLGARLAFDAWLGSDVTHHLNLIPRSEIESLLDRHGLRVIGPDEFSLKFTYPFLWSALLGRAFGTRTYDFDRIFGTLKDPLGTLRRAPLTTINAIASVAYLAPAIGVYAIAGAIMHRGEVLRLYVQPVAR